MPKENNKMQVDIDTLKKQNVNDLLSIKELYSNLEELGEKIRQVKYIDNTLVKKLKKEYENFKKIILDENIQVQLVNKIDNFNLKLTHDIETINSQLTNDIETINSQLTNDIETINSQLYKIDELNSNVNDNNSRLENIANDIVNKLKANDPSFDNGPIINEAIQEIWENKKTGRLIIPTGVYYIGTKIKPYPGVRIQGSGSGSNSFTTSTIFRPMEGFEDYLLGREDNIDNYLHYFGISDICFEGLNKSNGAFITLGESGYIRDVHFKNCVIGLNLKYQSAKTFIERVTINENKIGVQLDKVHGVSDIISLSGDNNDKFIKFINCGNSTTVNLIGIKAEDTISSKHKPLVEVDNCDGITLNFIGGFAAGQLSSDKNVVELRNGITSKNKINMVGFKQIGYVNLINDLIDNKKLTSQEYLNSNNVSYNTGLITKGQSSLFLESGTINSYFSNSWRQIFGTRSDGTTVIKTLSGSGGSIRSQDDKKIADFGGSGTRMFNFYGSIGHQLDILSEDTTINANHEFIMFDCTNGNRTITLQNADKTNKGRTYVIKKIDTSTNTLTIRGSVDGATNYTLDSSNKSVKLVSDGNTWQIY